MLTMIAEMRKLVADVRQRSLADLVALRAGARMIKQEFESLGEPVEAWLVDAIRRIDLAIEQHRADARALRIAQLRTEIAANKSRAERLADAKSELAALTGEKQPVATP